MTAYTDADLEAMLSDHESERKESVRRDAPRTLRETVCAFANDLPDHRRAGVVFAGARDDGLPSGIVVTDELLRMLADAVAECYKDFRALARRITDRCGVALP